MPRKSHDIVGKKCVIVGGSRWQGHEAQGEREEQARGEAAV